MQASADTSTLISIIALIVGSASLGWNVYRDVVLRARVRIGLAVVEIFSGGRKASHDRINISVTNLGPGPLHVVGINGMIAPWFRRLLRRQQHFVVLQDHTDPLSAKLPTRLEVSETADVYLPYTADSFLKAGATHIGVRDSFGRVHWAPRRHLREAAARYKRDFEARAGPGSK